MIQIFRKRKVQIILIFCLCSLLIGLFTVKLSVFAKEKSPYYIKVNKQQNCVTIYKLDENGDYTVPVKAMTCSSGVATPLGIFTTKEKYRWKLLLGDVWGQYSTRIEKGVLFHSVWYYEMDASTLSARQYNKLGTTASHGCIRLTVADAKWIYDNCTSGTTVEIYNSKVPGPLGKPVALILPTGTGWDPTDPSEENPFKDSMPSITGVSNKVLAWGTKMNLLKGVKAISSTGVDITSALEVDGKVDIYTAGKYKVTYSVSDATGKTAEKNIVVTVKACTQEPVIKGVKNQVVNGDTVVDQTFALKGVTAYLSTLQLPVKNIKVTIKKDDKKNIYSLSYEITAVNGLSGTALAKVYVDTTAPVLTGVSHREITQEQLESGKKGIQKLALEGITVSDDYDTLSVKDVKVTVQTKADYGYLVLYQVTDKVGNSTSETVQFTCFEDTRMDGIKNHNGLPYGTKITEDYVKQGVTASNSQGDCTAAITVDVKAVADSVYQVEYSVPDEDGNVVSITAYFTVSKDPATQDNSTGEEATQEDDTADSTTDSTQTGEQ